MAEINDAKTLTKPKKNHWLNSTIIGIGIASFFSDVGHEMATVALPALLATLGGGSAVLGIIEGVSDGLSSFSKLISGHYVERLDRRKPLAIIGYFATAIGMFSFAFATNIWQIFCGRLVGWIGRGSRTPIRNVLLTEATTPETYGRAFGLERSMDSAGAIVGPLIASALIITVGLRKTFLFTVIPSLLAVACMAFLVKERLHVVKEKVSFRQNISLLSSRYRKFLWGVGIAGLGDFSNTLLILWATQSWIPIYGIEKAGALAMGFYVGFNVVYTLTCYVGGSLADRFPRHYILSIGYLIATLPALALLIPGASFFKFAIVFSFSGLYMGIWETVEGTIAATLLPENSRGIGFGVLATVNGIGDLVSSIVVGFLWVMSPVIAMVFVIATALVGSVIILMTKEKMDGSLESSRPG